MSSRSAAWPPRSPRGSSARLERGLKVSSRPRPGTDIFCSVILSFLLCFARLFQGKPGKVLAPHGAFFQCHLVSGHSPGRLRGDTNPYLWQKELGGPTGCSGWLLKAVPAAWITNRWVHRLGLIIFLSYHFRFAIKAHPSRMDGEDPTACPG